MPQWENWSQVQKKQWTKLDLVDPQVSTSSPKQQVAMTTGHSSATGPTVPLVQYLNGQMVHAHSVIQSPQVQAISTIADWKDSQETVDSVTESQKCRETLSQCSSYR
ncbi:hypothetical protein JOB18_041740 [Solea senegalensis]|uniref:Uncharacterized protein n=1 Tax=Solea senegalensis TaxID=28829 RepID=A0AAV6PD03_SOLSE|nr:hypothetical protein JOB18_041740 [Solea senegalensis]